ncbi:unnamed protein product [Rotaria sp. Silwood1]|nr:unnamed protein product [Rotaria sp. Silwood1]
MENNGYNATFSSPAWQPIINSSAWFMDMYAITHPSQPNYIAMIAGSTLDCVDDSYFSTNETTIIDLLNRAGVSWKAYQESYTPLMTSPNCNDDTKILSGLYVRRHNPFMSSTAVRNSPTECEKIVNSAELAIDLANKQLPQFAFYTPNINNDAHDTNLSYAGSYLQNWLNLYLNEPTFMNGTLLIVTFDEDENYGNQTSRIPAFVWGADYLYSGVSIPGTFNHYSLTKLLEENWGLGTLGREDVTASSIMDIWRPTANSNSTTTQTTSTITNMASKSSDYNEIVWKLSFVAYYLMFVISMTC